MRNSAIQIGAYKYSDELANGDSADDREIHEDEDMNDDVVDVNGQTNRGYGSKVPSEYFAGNHIIAGSHITVPRDERPLRNSFLQINNRKYSDELANGDSSDNREIHEEEDMDDAVVDFNGHTYRGYGSLTPSSYFTQNHIMAGSHITIPRDEGPQPLRNNAAI